MLPKLQEKGSGVSSSSDLRKKAGQWLKERRCDLGLSQRELSQRVNMEYYTFISQIEAGRGRVPADRLRDWSIALEIDPRVFATTLLQYYDPHTYDMMFEGKNK
jgi:transcriptional regulator with XRE-family HTH domain